MPSIQITMTDTIRVPRPQGTTRLAMTLNKGIDPSSDSPKSLRLKTRKAKGTLAYHILKSYIIQGQYLNNEHVDIIYLCNYLQLPMKKMYRYLSLVIQDLGSPINQEQLQGTSRAILAQALNSALSDRCRALTQYEAMNRSQAGSYKPFISGTVNQAIKNLFDSTKGLTELYRALMPQQGTSINISQQQATIENKNFIGPEEAVRLLQDRGLASLPSPGEKEVLYQTHKVGSMPEVRAKVVGHLPTNQHQTISMDGHDNRRMEEEGLEDNE